MKIYLYPFLYKLRLSPKDGFNLFCHFIIIVTTRIKKSTIEIGGKKSGDKNLYHRGME